MDKKEGDNMKDIEFAFGCLVGKSKVMQEIYRLIDKVTKSDVNVLIIGESGTGKELVARSIHNFSPRREGPFVAINCASIPDSLLESELFGHEKGSFTGAIARRRGRFEMAHNGTIFFDEVSDMSPTCQAKILRIIEDRRFEPVGSEKTIEVNDRLIAASNKDLRKSAMEKKFREDLYHRLNEFTIQLPPLRERKEDIPLLIDYFIKEFSKRSGKKIKGMSDVALNYLMKYHWPGNVRELKNVIKRAIVLTESDIIWLEHLHGEREFEIGAPVHEDEKLLSLEDNERHYIEKVLLGTKWNKTKASKILAISRPRLDRKIKEYGIHDIG